MRSCILGIMCLLVAAAASAADGPLAPSLGAVDLAAGDAFHAQPSPGDATRDIVYMLGGPDRWDGRFETPAGDPDWHGWSHGDACFDPTSHWHVDDYNVPAGGGSLAMWCGMDFGAPCHEGYGNGWYDPLVFHYDVPDPGVPTTLSVFGIMNCDTEPGYDFVYLQVNRDGFWETLALWDGYHPDQALAANVAYFPGDYVDGTRVELRFLVETDGGWSDEDCLIDTQGAAQVDNLVVEIAGGPTFTDDFESGEGIYWIPGSEPSLDYTQLGFDLPEDDPDQDNHTWQVNWLGYPGGAVCFQPYLYTPALAVPPCANEIVFAYDYYGRSDPTGNRMWMTWKVRSTASVDPADLETAAWEGPGLAWPPADGFNRFEDPDVANYLVPGAQWLQIAFLVRDLTGGATSGEGAPYFDDAEVMAVCGIIEPDLTVTVEWENTETVSMYNFPNGLGQTLAEVGGTITVCLMLDGEPVVGYPAADIWVGTSRGNIVFCPGGSYADHDTDADGCTTFSGSFAAGGWSEPGELCVYVAGMPLLDQPPDLICNSPDISGDLSVNLTDVALFAGDLYDAMGNYRSDFIWDGTVNLSDVSVMAQGIGAACRGGSEAAGAAVIPGGGARVALITHESGRATGAAGPVTASLAVDGLDDPAALRGWELALDLPEGVELVSTRLHGRSLNLLEPPRFQVGVDAGSLVPRDGRLVLATLEFAVEAGCTVGPRIVGLAEKATQPDGGPVCALGPGAELMRLQPEEGSLLAPAGDGLPSLPDRLEVSVMPNPFNPRTEVAFSLPRAGAVRLAIYDVSGRRVTTLVEGVLPAGRHAAPWDGTDHAGREVPSGVYFSRLEADGQAVQGRMTLVR